MSRWPRRAAAPVLVLSALALAGCSTTPTTGPTATPSTSASGTAPKPSTRARGGASGSGRPARRLPVYAVTTRTVSGLGTILVDGRGRTLYLFAPDHHSGRSFCYHLCANQWPPVLLPKGVDRPIAAGGASSFLLGTTRRRNGTIQVTYAGWPLYWFVYDEAPGDATGEGLDSLGGYWWVLGPTGREITRL